MVLPDCKCLSEKEIVELEAYVINGGCLLSIGDNATATFLNQYRRDWGLGKIFNTPQKPSRETVHYDEVATSSTTFDSVDESAVKLLKAVYGKGSAIHVHGFDFQLPDSSTVRKFAGFSWEPF